VHASPLFLNMLGQMNFIMPIADAGWPQCDFLASAPVVYCERSYTAMGQTYQVPQQPQYGPPQQPPPQYPPQPPAPPARRRRPLWQWGCGALLLLLVCGGISAAVLYQLFSVAYVTTTVSVTANDPSAQLAPPGSTAASQSSLTVTINPSTVDAGGTAHVAVETTPNAQCLIRYTVSEGESPPAGMEDKSADNNGVVAWAWVIGPGTAKGDHPVMVTCDGTSVGLTLTVK